MSELAIISPPIIQTLSNFADLFTVLPSSSCYKEWICSHYSNIVFLHSAPDMYEFSFWDKTESECELIDYDAHINNVEKNSCLSEHTIVEYLKKLIHDGYYVIVELNQFFVPDTPYYQKYDYVHRQLFYGFSDEQKCFYTLGYHNNSKYLPVSVKYEDVFGATFEFGEKLTGEIHTIRPNNHPFEFKVEDVRNSYLHYWNSTFHEPTSRNDYYFGFQAMEKFHELVDAAKNGVFYDRKPVSMFYEHKKVQAEKLRIMAELGVKMKPQFISQANDISNLGYKVLLLYMKYGMDQKSGSINSIHDAVDIIIQKERILYEGVIDLLNV